MIISNLLENTACSKPPTSFSLYGMYDFKRCQNRGYQVFDAFFNRYNSAAPSGLCTLLAITESVEWNQYELSIPSDTFKLHLYHTEQTDAWNAFLSLVTSGCFANGPAGSSDQQYSYSIQSYCMSYWLYTWAIISGVYPVNPPILKDHKEYVS